MLRSFRCCVGLFCAGHLQVGVQLVENYHGQLFRPFVQLLLFQSALQANGRSDVISKSCSELTGLELRVADLPAGMSVVDSSARTALGIYEGEKGLSNSLEIGTIEPCFVDVDFRPCSSFRGQTGPLGSNLVCRVVVENPLAGFADDHLPAANIVISLWT